MPKTLTELRAEARATAQRIDDRLAGVLAANRDLTAQEEQDHTADQAALAVLKEEIATAEAAGEADEAGEGTTDVVAAERTRVLALIDICPNSAIGSGLRTAIADGVDAGAFAIGLATAAKTRGATMKQLKDGAVQPEQLPFGGKGSGQPGAQAKTGADKGRETVARLARMGHSAVKHLIPAK